MRKTKETYHSYERVLVIAILFTLQIAWTLAIMTRLSAFSTTINFVLRVVSFIVILFLFLRNENPAYRISWSILIALMPIFGGLLYLLMGNKRPTRGMRRAINQEKEVHQHELVLDQKDQVTELEKLDSRLAGLARYVQQSGDMSLYDHFDLTYYPNGESMMEPLIKDLRAAKKFIFLEFFIVEYGSMYDEIFEILSEKVQAGVDVRFIYDDFGSITRLPANYVDQLAEQGIRALKFNPVKPIISMAYNTRDHRKYIIIDGEIAYTGGVNIADEYINVKERFGYWKDNMIRVQGQACWNYTLMFLTMWNAFKPTDLSYAPFKPQATNFLEKGAIGFVQPYGDSPLDNEPIGEFVYRDMLNIAEDYVYIYTPYLVISSELQSAMILAAKRGVAVYLMTPGIPDKPLVYRMTRSYYRDLIKGGVRIFEYTPGFLHAKTFVVDGKVANVGTINLDYRSLYLHFETSTLIYLHPEIAVIEEDFRQSLEVSQEIGIQDTKRDFWGHLSDALLRLIAPFV